MGRFSFSSLRVRLVLLALLALVPAFGLILWNSLEQRRDEHRNVDATAVALTRAISAQEAQVVQSARELLGQIAGAPQVTGGDIAVCREYLAAVLAIESRYAGFGVANAVGDMACSTSDLQAPLNVADRAYFQRVIATGEFAIGDYVLARTSAATPVLPLAYPLFDGRGEVAGMVVTGVTLGWLNEFSASLALPKDATLTVIDPNGVVLARRPDPETWVGKSVQETAVGRTVLSVEEGMAELTGLDSRHRLYAFAPLGGAANNNAYVAVGLSTASVYVPINRTLVRNLSLLGAVTLLALLAAWFGGDWLVLRGVRALLGATRRVAAGDLSARSGIPHQGGEVNQLARSFDEMTASLAERESARQRAEAGLQQNVEELARSNAELEQFAYVASHDLQEPLRMVSNYTQLLARRYRGKLDDDADEFIGFAVEGATRLQTLINDLLSLSRIQTGGQEFAPTDTEDVLARAVASLQVSIAESGAEVTHDPLPAVRGDGVQLGQLLQNLIGNAIKFRNQDVAPRVHISAERDGASWRFSVQDNGIGIDPSYHDRIFVTFQRLHSRDRYPGTGIGLAVCKRIVERHGGRIWMESAPGEGTTFRFTLRAEDVERPEAATERSAA